MANVLIAQQDTALHSALAQSLHAEGHVVTEVSDGVLAMAALWVARRPLVAVLDEHLAPLDATDILEMAADGEVPLARHRYIVLTGTSSRPLRPALRDALRRLHAPLLSIREKQRACARQCETPPATYRLRSWTQLSRCPGPRAWNDSPTLWHKHPHVNMPHVRDVPLVASIAGR